MRRRLFAQELIRGLWGATLLLAPERLLKLVDQPSRQVEQAMRMLGVRHLFEVLVLARSRRRVVPRWPIIIDLLHGASMLAIAAWSRRVRRVALASAVVAWLLATSAEIERRKA